MTQNLANIQNVQDNEAILNILNDPSTLHTVKSSPGVIEYFLPLLYRTPEISEKVLGIVSDMVENDDNYCDGGYCNLEVIAQYIDACFNLLETPVFKKVLHFYGSLLTGLNEVTYLMHRKGVCRLLIHDVFLRCEDDLSVLRQSTFCISNMTASEDKVIVMEVIGDKAVVDKMLYCMKHVPNNAIKIDCMYAISNCYEHITDEISQYLIANGICKIVMDSYRSEADMEKAAAENFIRSMVQRVQKKNKDNLFYIAFKQEGYDAKSGDYYY